MNDIKWWAYRHKNGSIICKRYLDEKDIDEAYDSPFVNEVFGPYDIDSREGCLKRVADLLKRRGEVMP